MIRGMIRGKPRTAAHLGSTNHGQVSVCPPQGCPVPDFEFNGPSRWRLALALLTLPLLTGAGLRAALAVAYQQEAASVPGVVLALLLGSVLDAAVSLLALTPLLLLVIGSRATFFDGPWARRCVLGAWVFGLGFLATAEWFFWDEFTSRFNHIALDYLIYPHLSA
jgi:hypothetical protein